MAVEVEEPKSKVNEKQLAESKKKDKRKKKKKKKRIQKNEEVEDERVEENGNGEVKEDNVEIEYIAENPLEGIDLSDPAFQEFAKIFEHFQVKPDESAQETDGNKTKENDGENEEDDENQKKLSKKAKKREKRLSIAVLKQLIPKPELVEAWDVTSSDPLFLLFLKTYRNSVPVPRHWNQKRKYLQGKRGIEKPPFQLPEFIAATGISKIRHAIQEKEDAKKLKTKLREKMAPKLGKMDIDYQILHDAFFKYQTKPKLTIHGDLYFEGKEFEITMKEKKPGHLSEELKKSLGMPEGAPPPWLINMQRFGPPPSYPNLKIPGLNAPIPEGARYGYHPGGWGKPPVDEFGRPLYGDVFGTAPPEPPPEISQPIEKNHWGELVDEEEEEEPQESEMNEQEQEEGLETPSGLSTPSGMETPETLELRRVPTTTGKREAEPAEDDSGKQLYQVLEDDSGKQLYQVLEEKQMSVGNALYGSAHKYMLPEKKELKNKESRVDLMKSQKGDKIDVALTPEEVENLEQLSVDALKRKYETNVTEKQPQREDLSEMVNEHIQKKRKKEKEKDKGKDSKSKSYKDFRF